MNNIWKYIYCLYYENSNYRSIVLNYLRSNILRENPEKGLIHYVVITINDFFNANQRVPDLKFLIESIENSRFPKESKDFLLLKMVEMENFVKSNSEASVSDIQNECVEFIYSRIIPFYQKQIGNESNTPEKTLNLCTELCWIDGHYFQKWKNK